MPEFGKNISEVFSDTAARKQRAAEVRFGGQASSAEPPREVFLAGCQQIADAFAADGFVYARSSQKLTRKTSDFSFRILFQSSHHNIAGELVALWIHAHVDSKRIGAWNNARPRPSKSDGVGGGQIGNLLPAASWMEWNLADGANRAAVLSDAVATIRRVVLPFFALFDDVPALCERLVNEDVPGMDVLGPPIEFLLYFADRPRAEACMHRFLSARPEILEQYHRHLATFRSTGLPEVIRTGYAIQLAAATVEHGLTPPGST